MIISSDRKWKTDVEFDRHCDSAVIRHVEDTTAIAEQAKFMRDHTDRGFSDDRQYQLVGYIPFADFFGEGLHRRPMDDLMKYMESDKATPYRVSRKDTGNSGRIIVK